MINQAIYGYKALCGWMFETLNSQFHLDDVDAEIAAAILLFIMY